MTKLNRGTSGQVKGDSTQTLIHVKTVQHNVRRETVKSIFCARPRHAQHRCANTAPCTQSANSSHLGQKHGAGEDRRASPLVLCTFLVATHESSLNREFQGGACGATLVCLDFTWTTDIEVKHVCSPSVPRCSGLFHGNHTLLLELYAFLQILDHISPPATPAPAPTPLPLESTSFWAAGVLQQIQNEGCVQTNTSRSLTAGKRQSPGCLSDSTAEATEGARTAARQAKGLINSPVCTGNGRQFRRVIRASPTLGNYPVSPLRNYLTFHGAVG